MANVVETLRAMQDWHADAARDFRVLGMVDKVVVETQKAAACESGARAWELLEQIKRDGVWLLVERSPQWTTGKGQERIEGVALTNADASEFVSRNDEPGYARSSITRKVITYKQARSLVTGQEER